MIEKTAHRTTEILPSRNRWCSLLLPLLLLPIFDPLHAQTGVMAQRTGSSIPAILIAQQSAAPAPFLVAALAPAATESSSTSAAVLPDAPAPQVRSATSPPPPGSPETRGLAPIHSLVIPSNLRAQPLTAGDKERATLHDLYSIENIGAIFISAGYSHVTDGQPNYGVTSEAFGKRLGAAAIRDETEEIFANMVFAPVLHQDPRYYIKGDRYNVVNRTLYAITRPLITKTDSGKRTVNASLLLGYAAATALTPAYYPAINRNARDSVATFGGSIGGAALGFFVSEFSDDVLQAIHLKRAP